MLIESKSNLARLMATENLIVEQRQVQTACFDIKNRVLTVPILNGDLSSELYDLLLGHEVGHALETPEQGWHDSVKVVKVNRSILNVCEDARIEKKIKRKFPGIRISFVKGYRELLDMDFFGVKGKDLNTLNFIDRINLHTKGGAAQGIDFTTEEYTLLQEVEEAETFEETVEVSLKIQKFMKEQLESETQRGFNHKFELSNDDGDENQTTTINIVDDKLEVNPENGVPREGEPKEGDIESEQESGQQGDDNQKSEEKEDPRTGRGGSSGVTDDMIQSETDNTFRQKEENLYQQGKTKEMVYSNVPKILFDKVFIGHKDLIKSIEKHNTATSFNAEFFNQAKMLENFNKFRIESNKVVSYLVKEFEMRKNAEQQSRAKVSKTGELNLSKIHEYKFTDDIFARMTKVPNGKSHGLVMFLDWSGSMVDHINPTVKQLLNLVMFCKKVNIPFEVYAFSSYSKNTIDKQLNSNFVDEYVPVTTPKVGDINVSPFSLLNILSHKMSSNEFTKMASYLLDYGIGRRGTCSNMEPSEIMQLSGTPLNEAIMAAFEIIPQFKSDNKLEIVNTVFLTDGEGSSLHGCIDDVDKLTGRILSVHNVDSNYRKRSFLRDPITKASIEIEEASGYTSYSSKQTTALLRLLKQRTNCNLIGFYVAKVRDVRQALQLYTPKEKQNSIDAEIVKFRKTNFTYLDNVGYDEYYFLRSDKIDTDDEEEFEVTNTSTRGLVNAFSKYTGGRISNRIVLNRFINLIA
jgi:hypothetical protein